MSTNFCVRICLWSGPRNVSTALMYAFTQRSDTQAFDEPLYGHYLRVSGANHPGATEIMAAMECDATRVITNTILGPCPQPVLFFKSMAHHLVDIDWDFLTQIKNLLLIRDPVEMLPSLAQVLERPTLRDTGFKKQAALLQTLLQSGQRPPVLEARELLLNPASVLQQLCRQLNLPFEEVMLRWPAGPKPEDGVWAKYWYHNVHRSTGFQPYRPKSEPFPAFLRPLLEECQPYYEQLLDYAIKATPVSPQNDIDGHLPFS